MLKIPLFIQPQFYAERFVLWLRRGAS